MHYVWRRKRQRVNADTFDHAGPELVCRCGNPAQYRGRHDKTLESVVGPRVWNGRIVPTPNVRAGSALVTVNGDWRCFRSPRESCA